MNAPDWYWHAKYVNTPTVYDLAIQADMKVGAFLWPVTARSKIHYLLPEIFPNRRWDFQIFTALRNGSPRLLLRLFRRFGHMLNGITQPGLDDFVTEGVIDTIRQKSPDLLLVHFTDLDTARHNHGVNSAEAYEAIDRHAVRFEKIIHVLKEMQLYDETNIVILGDHAQLDFHTKVALNATLSEGGWLNCDAGKLKSWKAFAKSNGGSAYIYQNASRCDKSKLYEFLEHLQADPSNGIEKILTAQEAAAEGADPDCTFMLEARKGYIFTDFLGTKGKASQADHGYHPEDKPDFKTFYAMSGPQIKKGAHLDEMSILDIAPTWAKLLDLQLDDVDGKVLDIFL